MQLSHCRGVTAAFFPAQGFLTQPGYSHNLLLDLSCRYNCVNKHCSSLYRSPQSPNLTPAPAGTAGPGHGPGTGTAGTPFCETQGGQRSKTGRMCTAHFCPRRVSESENSLSWKEPVKGHLVQCPCHWQHTFNLASMLRVLSNLTWNVPRDGASTTTPGNLCQRFTTITAKIVFIPTYINPPSV